MPTDEITIDDLVNWYCEYYGIELWKDIPGYEGLYQVSNTGKVKSVERVCTTMGRGGLHKIGGRLLTQQTDRYGYKYVVLVKDGKPKHSTVHRLVATAFKENPDNLPCVDHIDANRSNNIASNLRWLSWKGNMNTPLYIEYRNNYRHSNESKDKISKSLKAHTRTPEHCKNISQAKRNNKPVCQYTTDGMFINQWSSVQDAVDYCSVSRKYFFQRMRKKCVCRGYLWEIKEGA